MVLARMKARLGRRIALDSRDSAYPMRALLPKKTGRTVRNWYDRYWSGNQGNTPRCVGYGWVHWLEDAPIIPAGRKHPIIQPAKVYQMAQQLDEWPGINYYGTSVRGGAKAIKQLGFIKAYYWAALSAAGLNQIIQAVLEVGPVVVGTDWYEAMFTPKSNGLIVPQGDIVGGHCYLINGVNTSTARFRIKNSWGLTWGRGGHAYITFDDFLTLLKNDGEACLGAEIGKKSPKIEG